jgi:hypothetical protein
MCYELLMLMKSVAAAAFAVSHARNCTLRHYASISRYKRALVSREIRQKILNQSRLHQLQLLGGIGKKCILYIMEYKELRCAGNLNVFCSILLINVRFCCLEEYCNNCNLTLSFGNDKRFSALCIRRT